MTGKPDQPVVWFESRQAWSDWLEEHHAASSGVWVKMAKKGTGIASITHAQALEVALCYGWIDGQSKSLDGEYWMIRFVPRRPRSRWSKINRDKATELIARGEMKPAGLREVEQAKADGRWDAAYDGPAAATVPDDLQQALDANLEARDFFATLDSRNRYAILYRIQEAKRPETRQRRIETFVAMLNRREKVYP